jgi:hypothetical protein
VPVRDLLAGVLDDRMHVGRVERVRIADVDLLLPRVGLALRILDRNAGAVEAVPDRAHHVLLLRGAHDRVVLVPASNRAEVAIVFVPERLEGLLEQVELELGRHHRLEPHGAGAGDLALQHRAGRVGDLLVAMVVEHVAHHHRRAGKPRHTAERREIGLVDVVAVARRPACRLVALHRVHLEIGGQQVVAAMRLLVPSAHEMRGVEALAHETALHVHDAGKHRVDLSGSDGGLQRVEGQVRGHGGKSLRERLRRRVLGLGAGRERAPPGCRLSGTGIPPPPGWPRSP